MGTYSGHRVNVCVCVYDGIRSWVFAKINKYEFV